MGIVDFFLTIFWVVAGIAFILWAVNWEAARKASSSDASPGTSVPQQRTSTYPPVQRTAVRSTPEASKRRFTSLAEAEQAVARSKADFARGGPRISKYSVPLDHAYEIDGVGYVSSKPKY